MVVPPVLHQQVRVIVLQLSMNLYVEIDYLNFSIEVDLTHCAE